VLPSKVIIHEDSNVPLPTYVRQNNPVIIQGPSGQIAGIDKCIALVDKDYFFHLEDDWAFTRTGFIAESLQALEDPKCVCHWLRSRKDTNGHPVEGDRMALGYNRRWHGFTFNPTLKRMADYPVGGYSAFCEDPRKPWDCESALGLHYRNEGMYASIAKERYVMHTGGKRHVNTNR